MPANSAAQQKAAAMALAAKRREIDPRVLKGAAWDMYQSMTREQLEAFASTARSDLPEHAGDKRRADKKPAGKKQDDQRHGKPH